MVISYDRKGARVKVFGQRLWSTSLVNAPANARPEGKEKAGRAAGLTPLKLTRSVRRHDPRPVRRFSRPLTRRRGEEGKA